MSIAESDRDALEKAERLRAFFNGTKPECDHADLSIGLSDDEFHRREAAQIDAAFAEFDTLMSDEPAPAPAATTEPTPAPDDESDCVRIDHAPVATPYDRARQRIEDAEILCATAEPGSADYHEAMAELAEAKRTFKLEQDRAIDDGYRKRRAIDDHRRGAGKDEYNAGRRKERSKPNARLKDMTPEQRAQHKLDQSAKRVWVCKKRKAGWTEERIEAELPGWWARRLAKRACA